MPVEAVTITDLVNAPDFADVCAAWTFGLWGSQSGGSLARALAFFGETARPGCSALTLVAALDGKAVGTVGLRASDFKGRLDLSPWLSSLYVHPEHRRSGVGRRLVGALEAAARGRGHGRLHLITEHGEGFYAGLGWSRFDRVVGPHGPAALMSKDLSGPLPPDPVLV